MKDIKDYLHLYLGCDCMLYLGEGEPDQKIRLSIYNLNYYKNTLEDLKPILRPLSDMREEEAIEVFKLVSNFDLSECVFDFNNDEAETWINAEYNGRVIDAIKFVGDNIEMMNNDGSFSSVNPISPLIHLYLSKGFDLFGLMESGLAIDKTKLP